MAEHKTGRCECGRRVRHVAGNIPGAYCWHTITAGERQRLVVMSYMTRRYAVGIRTVGDALSPIEVGASVAVPVEPSSNGEPRGS